MFIVTALCYTFSKCIDIVFVVIYERESYVHVISNY